MNRATYSTVLFAASLGIVSLASAPVAFAQADKSFADDTHYLALGDSLSSGFEAVPVTQGFTYQLYQSGVIDNLNNLLFCTVAVPGAASANVLQYQVPQAALFFNNTGSSYRKVVTLTAGGDDLLSLVGPGGFIDPNAVPGVLAAYGNNLFGILSTLITAFPDVKIYVANSYDPKLPVIGEDQLVAALNQVTATVTAFFPNNVTLVDIFSAFEGRSGLLLIERKNVGIDIHPTNGGYQVMTAAFKSAITGH